MDSKHAEVRSLQQQLAAAASQHQKEVRDLKKAVKRMEQAHNEAAATQQPQPGTADPAAKQVQNSSTLHFLAAELALEITANPMQVHAQDRTAQA